MKKKNRKYLLLVLILLVFSFSPFTVQALAPSEEEISSSSDSLGSAAAEKPYAEEASAGNEKLFSPRLFLGILIVSLSFSVLAFALSIASLILNAKKKIGESGIKGEREWSSLINSVENIRGKLEKLSLENAQLLKGMRAVKNDGPAFYESKKSVEAITEPMGKESKKKKGEIALSDEKGAEIEKTAENTRTDAIEKKSKKAKPTGKYVVVTEFMDQVEIKISSKPKNSAFILYEDNTVGVDEKKYKNQQCRLEVLARSGMPELFDIVVRGNTVTKAQMGTVTGLYSLKKLQQPALVKIDGKDDSVTIVEKGKIEFEE